MTQHIAHFTLTIRDYDEALAYYTAKLGFTCLEDTDLGGGKRWVRVSPPGSTGSSILLARATNDRQEATLGNQTGGRVFIFLETDDFSRDYGTGAPWAAPTTGRRRRRARRPRGRPPAWVRHFDHPVPARPASAPSGHPLPNLVYPLRPPGHPSHSPGPPFHLAGHPWHNPGHGEENPGHLADVRQPLSRDKRCLAEITHSAKQHSGHGALTLRVMADIVPAMAGPVSKDYSLAEITKLTGYSERMIRRYVAMGCVPPPLRRGREARFSREHLGRFLAIARLRREERSGTPDVRSRMDEITPEEVEAWAEQRDPLRPAVRGPAQPLPLRSPVAAPGPQGTAVLASVGAAEPRRAPELEPVTQSPLAARTTLLPGLDLVLREGASEIVVRVAREIVARYGAS